MSPTCVLITNGNAMSMLALNQWIAEHGLGLRKVFVTYRLPSARGNIRGVCSLLRRSGWSYTYLKVWTNRLLPRQLRRRGLPASVSDLIAMLGLDVSVEPVASVNTPAIVDELRRLDPDYLVSFSATHRFGDEVIQTPKVAAVNVHYGALPAYAGLSPYFWHLLNQEPQFGVTLHRIIPKLDAGPIIEQVLKPTSGIKTSLELALRMSECVSPLLCRLFDGRTTVEQARPQPAAGRSYFRHPTRRQVREFHRKGFAMLGRESRAAVVRAVSDLAARVSAEPNAGVPETLPRPS